MRIRMRPQHVVCALIMILVAASLQIGAQTPHPVRPRHTTGSVKKKSGAKQTSSSSSGSQQKAKDKFHRPPLATPIRPMVSDVSRFQPNKVFLENADSLYKNENDASGKQIVKGGVVFRQADMWLYCDSAYFYPERNSLDAFGHVKLKQNSVTSMEADRLFYNGDTRFARLRCGRSQSKVVLRDKGATLTTDSLDYDLNSSLGWYDCGGTLIDGPTRLTSLYGQYDTHNKDAEFFHNVVLHNSKDNYTLLSDTLYYNTATKIASIVSPTTITSPEDEILASNGWYNTATGMTQLTSRSLITHHDSLGRATTLEGDSLVYDKSKGITYAYSYRSGSRYPNPVILTDTAHKTMLIGGYGLYDQVKKLALATEFPLLIEFSRPDTLFMRADTILTYIENIPDSLMDSILTPEQRAREWRIAKAYQRARFFNQQAQGIADSMVFIERDSMLRMYRGPILWSGERQVYGPVINVHFNDSTADTAELPRGGTAAEYVDHEKTDSFYNQLRGRRMFAILENKELKHLDVEGNVEVMVLPQESDSTYNRLVNAESSYMSVDMRGEELGKLKMWPEVTGYVTPLFLMKPGQQLLRDFKWYGRLRPEREWYGERVRWVDNLGEVDDELDAYFRRERLKNSKD